MRAQEGVESDESESDEDEDEDENQNEDDAVMDEAQLDEVEVARILC